MRSLKKSVLAVLVLFTLLAFCFSTISHRDVTATVRIAAPESLSRRLAERKFPNQPVQILSVANSTGVITLGKELVAENDWLKGLSVTVKNLSSQNIRFIEVELAALRTKDVGDPAVALYPVNNGPPITELSKLIRPEDSVNLKLVDKEYEVFQQLLKATKYETVVEAELILHKVIFEDNTMWIDGHGAAKLRKTGADSTEIASSPKPNQSTQAVR